MLLVLTSVPVPSSTYVCADRGRTGAGVPGSRPGRVAVQIGGRTGAGVPGSRPGRVAVRSGLELVTFSPCLVLIKPRKP